MGLLRSENMKHGTLVVPADRARHYIDLIGSNCKVQFTDMNAKAMKRPYKRYTQRLEEMERIIRFLTDELERIPGVDIERGHYDAFLAHADSFKLEDVEMELKQLYSAFATFKEHNSELVQQRNAYVEHQQVVKAAMTSLAHVAAQQPKVQEDPFDDDMAAFEFGFSRSLLEDERSSSTSSNATFSNIAGVVHQVDQDRLARAIFRATHGNTFTHFQPIQQPLLDPKTGKIATKAVFVVYFHDTRQQQRTSAMSEKIKRICGAFGVNVYSWPLNRDNAQQTFRILSSKIEDHNKVVRAHEEVMRGEGQELIKISIYGGNSQVEDWRLYCVKEKSIYATLNLFEGSNVNLRADCWYPAADEAQIRAIIIRQSTDSVGSSAMLVSDRYNLGKNPPTYIRTNSYTEPFQLMVNTYGFPRNGEANPMLLTVVTFPFLFGVMFGDVGHGLMLLSIGLWGIYGGKDVERGIPTLYWARYMITAMGAFAVYMGLLYNDFFSVGFDFFGSRWTESGTDAGGRSLEFKPAYDTQNAGGAGPYPFGLDPAWHGASNELLFLNSLKMKMSVILGVTQMSAGLVLRWMNAWHEGSFINMVCECAPMTVFMMCFFGFMDVMIMYKWVTPMQNPPSIINSMIAMGMFQDDPNAMFGPTVPFYLMTASVLAVPVMLLPKPLYLAMQHRQQEAQRFQNQRIGELPRNNQHGLGRSTQMQSFTDSDDPFDIKVDEEEEEPFDLADIVIHQIIETIEYVLGTVSHTASYLRLWALSLAHQQLSQVFFQKTLLNGMAMPFPLNSIALFFLFGFWFALTSGILLGMDVMECFLHTLRLHWVEFQSKFYKADGHEFAPYRHRAQLEASSQA